MNFYAFIIDYKSEQYFIIWLAKFEYKENTTTTNIIYRNIIQFYHFHEC